MQDFKSTKPLLIVAANRGSDYLTYETVQKQVCNALDIDLVVCETGAPLFKVEPGRINIPPVEGVSDIFVAQVIRFIAPCFFPERYCILGDIDMLFLSRRFVNKMLQFASARKDGITLVDSDTYRNILRFPMCYYLGYGIVFSGVIDLNTYPEFQKIETFIKELQNRGEGWTTDEYFLAESLQLKKDISPVYHWNSRIKTPFGVNRTKLYGRINRNRFKYSRFLLMLNYYIDAHSLVPIRDNTAQLCHLLNYVYSDLNGWKFFKYELKRLSGRQHDLFPSSLCT